MLKESVYYALEQKLYKLEYNINNPYLRITMEKKTWTAKEAARVFQGMLDAKQQWLEEVAQAEAKLAL